MRGGRSATCTSGLPGSPPLRALALATSALLMAVMRFPCLGCDLRGLLEWLPTCASRDAKPWNYTTGAVSLPLPLQPALEAAGTLFQPRQVLRCEAPPQPALRLRREGI